MKMVMFRCIFMLLLVAETLSLQHANLVREWNMFKQKYNRTYSSDIEETYRYGVFTDNIRAIHLHNMAADKGHHSFWLAINHFADLTDKEYESKMIGL
ncbi:crustapain-like [Ruditapes philippinarum]|uniref:crustapain-like n=1 Tax=Ruditapes philippinarum TaxID=129788 RepID=UPI00295B37C0|nr:crustapain-like [Ruditapes philippinarum]